MTEADKRAAGIARWCEAQAKSHEAMAEQADGAGRHGEAEGHQIRAREARRIGGMVREFWV